MNIKPLNILSLALFLSLFINCSGETYTSDFKKDPCEDLIDYICYICGESAQACEAYKGLAESDETPEGISQIYKATSGAGKAECNTGVASELLVEAQSFSPVEKAGFCLLTECCSASDPCGLADNGSCDCPDIAWDKDADCAEPTDAGDGNAMCCYDADPCELADNGKCECPLMTWDKADCCDLPTECEILTNKTCSCYGIESPECEKITGDMKNRCGEASLKDECQHDLDNFICEI